MNAQRFVVIAIVRLVCAIGTLFVAIPISTACTGGTKFEYSFFSHADVVFRGRVERYEKTGPSRAAIDFSVVTTLKGQDRQFWTARWNNSSFKVPENWDAPINVIVGLIMSTDRRDKVGTMVVLQKSCSSPNLIEDTEVNRVKLQHEVPSISFPKN